ncbi:Maf family protein [Histidinibacterium lentulum]|uniref:dTTP/UTP pyrophosphatase n=1 Tax=Histidinibacterium lentulum TaxID=2480588 RepID=A0A3N2QWF8_9RHOB|nr:Maf family protein [Histidinibacterium lentulum]ROT99502.1 septum formation protein Maf [Histidinibacterium lentulum]
MSPRAPDPALRLVLASASPRRLDLLSQLGLEPDAVRPPEIDETPRPRELPRDYVRRMALEKAEASDARPGEVVLAADTTVTMGRRILGKPRDAEEARRFLEALSGRRHRVITAIAARRGDEIRVRDVLTQVRMKRLSPPEIAGYLATGDWQGKAGGYGIQGPAGAFIPWISGSHPAVMGLPLAETAALLTTMGYVVWR